MKKIIALVLVLALVSCGGTPTKENLQSENDTKTENTNLSSTKPDELKTSNVSVSEEIKDNEKAVVDYKGNGNVFSGLGELELIENNIYDSGNRVAAIASFKSDNGKVFKFPADTHYLDENVAFARDLYNPNGTMYEKSKVAAVSYENKDAFVIDEDGEVFTSYIFANNYFEMYVNGVLIAKDKIPYTDYNSSIVKFKVKRPFHYAFRAVDWEEDLGLGREANRSLKHTATEGGIVFVFKKGLYDIVGISNEKCKAQTFYTSPVEEFSQFKESGELRDSSAIKPEDLSDEAVGYGIVWDMPDDVFSSEFDDSAWQSVSEYSTEDLNIDELPAYKNFRDVFDASPLDAKFIWTNNLYLDNDVVIRGVVE